MPPKVKFQKEEIVAAAADVAREKGAQAVTARDVAAKLGVSTRPIFTYFDTMDELKEMEGIGDFTACRLMAAIELGKRRQLESARQRLDISSPTAVYNLMRPQMMDLEHEEAHVLLLNQNYKLIKQVRLSQGGITETSVDIRVIMKNAILNNATVLVLCHNHPSGNTRPSKEDDRLTEYVKKACDIMRIYLNDHVIITDGNYYSYREQGRI